jgi:Tfp pilus assembly protein PilP
MKLAWVSFLLIGLFVQSLMAQDPEDQETDNEIDTSAQTDMQMPAPSKVNPMKQALDSVVNEQDVQNGIKQLNNSNSLNLGERDPFQRPKYIDDLEMDAMKNANIDSMEDDRVEAIRRWPLRDYRATAIMWDISTPKVMIVDRRGTLHLLKKNYRIGNRSGIVTAINEGEIIVTEKGIPVVMKIDASGPSSTRQEDL